MLSPMIYQDLTTAALLDHAAHYHRETEIVSVSTDGAIERSCWGRWLATPADWRRRCQRWVWLPAPAAARWRGTTAAIWRSILASHQAVG